MTQLISIVLFSLAVVAVTSKTPEKVPSFSCPDNKELSLVSTTISGCKVFYTCENGKFLKLFQCSEAITLNDGISVCQEDPQCVDLYIFKQLEGFSRTKSANLELATSASSGRSFVSNDTLIETVLRFMKCTTGIKDTEEFYQNCVDATLFNRKPFMEIELSPEALEVYSLLLNATSAEYEKYYPTWDIVFGRVLNRFVQYLAPQCDVTCKPVSDPDSGITSFVERVRRHVFPRFNEWRRSHLPLRKDFIPPVTSTTQQAITSSSRTEDPVWAWERFWALSSIYPMYDSYMTTSTEVPVSTEEPEYMKDNRTLMNDIIIPIIRDIVNDQEALDNVTRLFRVVVEASVPLATAIVEASNESIATGEKSVIKIPRVIFKTMLRKLQTEALPIFRSVLEKKFRDWIHLMSKNVGVLMKSYFILQNSIDTPFLRIIDKSNELLQKYYGLFRNSTADHVFTYSLTEIQKDLESLFSVLPDDSLDLLRKNVSVFQDVLGINVGSIANMLLDIPGIFDIINVIPPQFLISLLMLII